MKLSETDIKILKVLKKYKTEGNGVAIYFLSCQIEKSLTYTHIRLRMLIDEGNVARLADGIYAITSKGIGVIKWF